MWAFSEYRSLITVILAIPWLIKNSKFLDYRDFLLIIPRNTMILIIKVWDFFLLPGTFSGPSHPDNQGLTVYKILIKLIKISKWHIRKCILPDIGVVEKVLECLKSHILHQNHIHLFWTLRTHTFGWNMIPDLHWQVPQFLCKFSSNLTLDIHTNHRAIWE